MWKMHDFSVDTHLIILNIIFKFILKLTGWWCQVDGDLWRSEPVVQKTGSVWSSQTTVSTHVENEDCSLYFLITNEFKL